jgi:hypothetical protein
LEAADGHTLPVAPQRLRATASYLIHPWYRVPKALAILLARKTRGCAHECGYVVAGGLRVIDKVYSFGAALHHEQGVALALGGPHQYRAKERHINARRARGLLITAALGAVAILGLWLGVDHPAAGGLTGVGLVTLLDAIGRRGRPKDKPARKPQPLHPGMPERVLWGQIDTFLIDYGADHAVRVYDVRVDTWREAFQVDIHTDMYELDAKFLRALAQRLRARLGAIRVTPNPANAADKTLTIPFGDPLAKVPEAPWITAGSVSGWQPLDLGYSSNHDAPFELVLVMQHVMLISRTRGGKTVHISNIIDRLSACRDVIPCAGALVKSAVFDSWRSVLHKKAESISELENLLLWALDEIAKRDRRLKEINSDDDPSNDVDKWDASLGPAIVIVVDEWSEASEYDGTKLAGKDYKPNILNLMKRITRTGAGLGVSVILSVQASGNQDWGSSVLNKQTSVKIMGPCTEDDTVAVLGKDKRDQGYAPHFLRPADAHNPNDAGVAVIDGPGFGSDYVRGYAPFAVKARAMKREKEWEQLGNRPTLPDAATTPAVAYIDAQTIPAGLYLIDKALRHYNSQVLSSEIILQYAAEQDECDAHGNAWTANNLAKALRQDIPGNDKGQVIQSWLDRCSVLCAQDRNKRVRCYRRTDVDQAMQAIAEAP